MHPLLTRLLSNSGHHSQLYPFPVCRPLHRQVAHLSNICTVNAMPKATVAITTLKLDCTENWCSIASCTIGSVLLWYISITQLLLRFHWDYINHILMHNPTHRKINTGLAPACVLPSLCYRLGLKKRLIVKARLAVQVSWR